MEFQREISQSSEVTYASHDDCSLLMRVEEEPETHINQPSMIRSLINVGQIRQPKIKQEIKQECVEAEQMVSVKCFKINLQQTISLSSGTIISKPQCKGLEHEDCSMLIRVKDEQVANRELGDYARPNQEQE